MLHGTELAPGGTNGDVLTRDSTQDMGVRWSGGIVSNDIHHIIKLTQAAYDALSPPAADTLYVIVG